MAAPASTARRCRISTRADPAQPEFLPGLFQPRADLPLSSAIPGKAQADYNRAIQINPNYDAAYIGRGDLYRKAGQTQHAFNDFQKAIQLDTTDGRAYHRRGLIYQSQGQHNFAIEDFSTAISLSPDSPEPYNGRGVSYLALNDDDNAFADFNQAIKLNGKHRRELGQPGAGLRAARRQGARRQVLRAGQGSSTRTTSRRSTGWRAPAAPEELALIADRHAR